MAEVAGAEVTGETNGVDFYYRCAGKKMALLLVLPLLLLISVFFDVVTGPAALGKLEVLRAIISNDADDATLTIVRTMRLPIALMAVGVGGSLGLAGALMQTILNNPLASPYTLGVGAGASFGASLAIVSGAGLFPGFGEYLISINAFFFAMTTCLIVYGLGRLRGMSAGIMVLAGIALLFMFQALQALLQYGASEGELQSIVFWSFGSLQRASWPRLGLVAVVLSVCLPLVLSRSWQYTALLMGDEKAQSLGIDVERLKLFSFFLISLLAAVAVCFVGTIGFIGLAGPHIARMLVGDDQRFYLPVSALGGALILSAASIVSKSIIPGIVFPIGIVTSVIGVPFFFMLILKRKY